MALEQLFRIMREWVVILLMLSPVFVGVVMPTTNQEPMITEPLSSHRHIPFFRLWFPSLIIFFANTLATFGLNWWLATSAGGGSLLGIVVGIAEVASLLVVILYSRAIDRSHPKAFLLRTLLALAATLSVLLLSFGLGVDVQISLAVACGVYLAKECAVSLYQATMETTLASSAPLHWATSRTALLSQLQPQIARFLAPLVGGFLLGQGMAWELAALATICVVVGMLPMYFWPTSLSVQTADTIGGEQEEKKGASFFALLWSDAADAFRWMRNQPVLLYMLVIAVLTNLFLYPFTVLLPLFLEEHHLSNSSILYGQSLSAYGAGMIIASILLTFFLKKNPSPIWSSSLLVLLGIGALGVVSLYPEPLLLIMAMALSGGVLVSLIAIDGGVWLDLTPPSKRVRVFSLRRLVAFGSIPLGTTLMGVGGSIFGFTPFLLLLLGSVTVILIASWFLVSHQAKRNEGRFGKT